MTERESFELIELKHDLAQEYDYTCPVCGRSLSQYGTYQLAHRIAQSEENIKKYGKEIIHDRLNLVPVCSLRCNDACNIGHNPEAVKTLVKRIESVNNHDKSIYKIEYVVINYKEIQK